MPTVTDDPPFTRPAQRTVEFTSDELVDILLSYCSSAGIDFPAGKVNLAGLHRFHDGRQPHLSLHVWHDGHDETDAKTDDNARKRC